MNTLLKFLHLLFRVLGRFSPVISAMATAIPSSVYLMQKSAGHSGQFTKYVVCCKCHTLYKLDDAITCAGTHESSKACCYIRFPNHPHRRFRAVCGQQLLKKVYFSSGRQILYPFKVYPYRLLTWSLQSLLLRPNISELCQHWKLAETSGILYDIYDGQVWKDFQVVSGQPFLSSPYGLGLMVNVDWFQPYKHTSCSVGAVYLTIMNLPRSVRFRREYIILVGVLPGPSEPKHDINTYLEPVVSELSELWTGVTMQVRTASGVSSKVRYSCLLKLPYFDAPRMLSVDPMHNLFLGSGKHDAALA